MKNYLVVYSKKSFFTTFLFLFLLSFQIKANEIQFFTLQDEIKLLEGKYKKKSNDLFLLQQLVEKYNLNTNYIKAEKTILEFKNRLSEKRFEKCKPEIYLLLAITYKYQLEFDKSAIYFFKTRDIYHKEKNYLKLINLGAEYVEFFRKQGRYEDAEKNYYKYYHLSKIHKINDPKVLNKLFNRFAAVLNETGRGHISINYSKKAIEESEKSKDFNSMAISYNEMGFSYKNMRKNEESADCYLKAEEIWMKLGYYRDAIHAKMNRIIVLSHNLLISPQESIDKSLEVVNLIDKYKIDYSKKDAYDIIRSSYANHLKDYEKAFFYEQKFSQERFSELVKTTENNIFNIQEKYDNENLQRKNKVIAFQAREKQLELENVKTRVIFIAIILFVVVSALIALFIFWMRLRIANKLLIVRNNQKTILVQEIHHRVKNNMQFVKSMLEMQIGVEDSESSTKSLEDVYRRIDAMSLVHEMLFIDEANMNLSIKDYLEKLIDFSNMLYNKEQKITFNLNCVNVELPIDQIVSIGIICTELLTNSIKYAFVEKENPIISFDLSENEESYVINYSDNGIGMTEKDDQTRKTLGMRLIDIFSRQLNGEYSIQSSDGFNFKLNFKK